MIFLYIAFRLIEVLLRATPAMGTVSPEGFSRSRELARKWIAGTCLIFVLVAEIYMNWNMGKVQSGMDWQIPKF